MSTVESTPNSPAAAAEANLVVFVASASSSEPGRVSAAAEGQARPGRSEMQSAAQAVVEARSREPRSNAARRDEELLVEIAAEQRGDTEDQHQLTTTERERSADILPTGQLMAEILDPQRFSWTEIKERLDANPADALYRDPDNGLSPLVVALMRNGVPATLLSALLVADPNALRARTRTGFNALNIAFNFLKHLDREGVDVLLSAKGAAEALIEGDEDGETPLHGACYAWRRAMNDGDESAIALAEYIITMVLERYPKSTLVETPFEFIWLFGVGIMLFRVGVTIGDPDLELMSRLLPIGGPDSEWKERLAEKMTRFATQFIDAAETASRNDEGVRSPEDKARLLAHRAIEFSVPLKFRPGVSVMLIRLLQQRAESSSAGRASLLTERDELLRVPLHRASLLEHSSDVAALVEACPTAASMLDKAGSLPLFTYLRSGQACVEGAVAIARAYPEALTVRDARTQLYPFMLAAAVTEIPSMAKGKSEADEAEQALVSAQIAYELLKMDPTVLKCSAREMQFPAVL